MSELAQLASIPTHAAAAGANISVATVVSINDQSGLGRVEVRLRWNPSATLWARVAMPMAGPSSGTYFIPQVDDEVLVAFHQTDLTEVYVIGCLWSSPRRPPKSGPSDPKNLRCLRTPAGHELLFDDQNNLVRIVTAAQQTVSLAQDRIELSSGQGKSTLTLGADGQISIKASQSISLEAPQISINGSGKLELKSAASASLSGGGLCEIKAGMIRLN